MRRPIGMAYTRFPEPGSYRECEVAGCIYPADEWPEDRRCGYHAEWTVPAPTPLAPEDDTLFAEPEGQPPPDLATEDGSLKVWFERPPEERNDG